MDHPVKFKAVKSQESRAAFLKPEASTKEKDKHSYL
jgi:hypothetical protein